MQYFVLDLRMLYCPCIMLRRDLFIENTATKFLPHLSHTKSGGILDKDILNKYSGKRFLPKAVKKSQPSTPCQLLGAARVKLQICSMISEAAGILHSQD